MRRLSGFTHGSYCRVRRVQHTVDLDRPIVLVSTHVAGRRLAEILDRADRADLKPPTAGVLALTHQLMTAVALLHDFAPDGFHGALGPERLILPGDGRVVIAEHVLGSFVAAAAEAWGVTRLWQDFRIAALPNAGLAHYGRRVDVLQIGLTVLALLLGRTLGETEFPDGVGRLIGEVAETHADGTVGPLGPGLRRWLERTLAPGGESSFETLLDSQKAFGQVLEQEPCNASSSAWEAFVRTCETAAVRIPAVVVVPEPSDAVPSAAPEPTADAGEGKAAEVDASVDGTPGVAADPFGPWPVAVPTESAATLFETFLSTPPPAEPAPPLKEPPPVAAAKPASDPWSQAKASPVNLDTALDVPKAEPASIASVQSDARVAAPSHWIDFGAVGVQPTSVADWQAPEAPAPDAAIPQVDSIPRPRVRAGVVRPRIARSQDSRRWVRLVVIGVVSAVATAGAVYGPLLWTAAYEAVRRAGIVTVESAPAGALISVDGQMRGHTPATLKIQPGEHLLEVQAGGSAKSKTIVVAPRANMTETFTLPEAGDRGGFWITTYPESGRITIDGKYRGDSPVKVTDLTPGTHTLVVETRLGSQAQDVIVQPGTVPQLAVPTASWVKTAAPYDLKVFEDGRLLGTAGRAPVLVRPGPHHLEFVNQELGLKLRQFIDAAPGQVVTVPLELPTGMINLFSDQPAEVYVDGEKVGDTPLSSLQVPLGSHEVVARHPKYGEVRYTVRVTLTAPVQLRVKFRK